MIQAHHFTVIFLIFITATFILVLAVSVYLTDNREKLHYKIKIAAF